MKTIHTALAMLIVVAAAMLGTTADARFLANDPVPFNPNDPAQFNRYIYANGDPITMFDPDGRDSALRNRALIRGNNAPAGLRSEGSLVSGSIGGDIKIGAGFVPIVGDGIAIGDAINSPSPGTIIGAGVGLVPIIGDVAAGAARGGRAASGAVRGTGNATLPEGGTVFVDSAGNAMPGPPGGTITGSRDGNYVQVRDADGNTTGTRKDGGHNPNTHSDPRAQGPHGHQPGVTNEDGTPWLPLRENE